MISEDFQKVNISDHSRLSEKDKEFIIAMITDIINLFKKSIPILSDNKEKRIIILTTILVGLISNMAYLMVCPDGIMKFIDGICELAKEQIKIKIEKEN